MSRLTKTTTAASLAPNSEAPDQPYLPQHPMLQYKVAPQEKKDHLVNYQEVRPYPAEIGFSKIYNKFKEALLKRKRKKTEATKEATKAATKDAEAKAEE